MSDFDIKDLERRMKSSLDAALREFAGLRTGRATPSLLDPVTVEAYGSRMTLAQVAGVNAPEPRMLSVSVWDASLAKAVEKAIRDSGLGLNPVVEGTVMRIPIPELNAERRAELAKVAGRYAEAARVAIRNIRRDGLEQLRKAEKAGEYGQDESRRLSDQVQKLTEAHIAKVDGALADKEAEISQV